MVWVPTRVTALSDLLMEVPSDYQKGIRLRGLREFQDLQLLMQEARRQTEEALRDKTEPRPGSLPAWERLRHAYRVGHIRKTRTVDATLSEVTLTGKGALSATIRRATSRAIIRRSGRTITRCCP